MRLPRPTLCPARRGCLRRATAWGAALLTGSGCRSDPPLLRIGAHPWPGYELMFLARSQGRIESRLVRLVELPTATASLRALAAGTLDGAGLTLDEVLSARASGLMLRVVALINESQGADALLARPGIGQLAALRGQRIGLEQTATGALMLDAALGRAGLAASDVRLVPMSPIDHGGALRSGRVDALVTHEPTRSRLLAEGARQLFSSAQVPGLIIDVLAVRPEAAARQAVALRSLVAGMLQARASWLADPSGLAGVLAPRLRLTPHDVLQAFGQLHLPDLAANRRWLQGPAPGLHVAAARLVDVMQRAALLPAGARPLAGSAGAAAAPLAVGRVLPA